MSSAFDRLFSEGALGRLLSFHGQPVTYTTADGTATSLTAIVVKLEVDEETDDRGRAKLRSARVTCSSDPDNSQFGGIANPQLNATITIAGELFTIDGKPQQIGGYVELVVKRSERMEVSRENYRKW